MYVTLRVWRANEGGTTICPTTPKLSHVTERCLKTKLQISASPRNGTYILLAVAAITCFLIFLNSQSVVVLRQPSSRSLMAIRLLLLFLFCRTPHLLSLQVFPSLVFVLLLVHDLYGQVAFHSCQ